jgi:geranylgeranyl reductase family protein
MERIVDVAVVGAGPAGSAAAITAAERGLSVVCVDKATFPRDKTCGDGITANGLRLVERLGMTREGFATIDPQIVRETVVVSPSGRRVVLPMPGDGVHGAIVERSSFDAALVDLARSRGVDVREDETFDAVEVHDDHVRLDGLRARFLVAADGHWSPVRRAVQPDTPRDLGEWHAVRQYFEGVADERLFVVFERDLLPGYAWVFPLPGGRANVGFGVLRAGGRSGHELKALWPDLLARPIVREILGDKARPLEAVHAWPIPTRYEPARLMHGSRVLFAGDAAGLVDPMTGEGIAQAIETGMLAADSITTGADYKRLVHHALGRDLRFAARLQQLLAKEWAARGALKAVDLGDWTRRSFARWLWEDYPRAVVGTPDRWHRDLFRAPGAFRMT